MIKKNNTVELSIESIPTLENLEVSLRSKRMLGNVLGRHGPASKNGKQIADGLVRLVEKAVQEYKAAIKKFALFMCGNGEFDNYCRAQDHMESCIQSLHRAICYIERLRRMGFRQAEGAPFIPKPREIEFLRDEAKGRVRKLRDACEHLDKDIIAGKLGPDDDVAICLRLEGVDLSGISILYNELARWIEQIHHFAILLSQVHIVVDGSAPLGNAKNSTH